MSYVVRYSPSARKDIDKVWDDMFSASASLEVTERYITDFLDVIAQKRSFRKAASLCITGASLPVFIL